VIPVFYKIVSLSRKKKGTMDTIALVTSAQGISHLRKGIEVSDWNNWPYSKWVRLFNGDRYIVVDSGVIIALAEELKKLGAGKP